MILPTRVGRLLVRDLIRELRERGTTVFLNSHLLGEVEATCDRVAFVKEGRTVGGMSLRDSPDALDVELRIDRVDPAILTGLARFGSGVAHVDGTVRLHVDGDESLPALAGWLVASGVRLYSLQSRRHTLEERFLEIMGDDQRPG